jgi:hypothetical protein
MHFKFLAAPVLRGGDTYSNRNSIGFEMRQWDFPSVGVGALPKQAGHLIASVEMLSKTLHKEGNLKIFEEYAELELSSSALLQSGLVGGDGALSSADVALFEERIKTAILNLPHAQAKTMKTVDPGTRFAFPFRDWASYPLLSSLPQTQASQIRKSIQAATKSYKSKLVSAFRSGVAGEELTRELRISLAQWAVDSKLFSMYRFSESD